MGVLVTAIYCIIIGAAIVTVFECLPKGLRIKILDYIESIGGGERHV